jgi:hypothetical protein
MWIFEVWNNHFTKTLRIPSIFSIFLKFADFFQNINSKLARFMGLILPDSTNLLWQTSAQPNLVYYNNVSAV